MFKRLSLFAVVLSGVLLAGCANQQSTSTESSAKTEQTKSKKKAAPKKATKAAPKAADSQATDSSDESNDDTDTNASTSKTGSSQQTTTSGTTANDSNSGNNNTNTQTTDNSNQTDTQQSQTQAVNLTTADQAVTYLANQLGSTYNKTTTQYVANVKTTWNNVEGYQVNIYSKNSDSPIGSYLVPANGQYFQIW